MIFFLFVISTNHINFLIKTLRFMVQMTNLYGFNLSNKVLFMYLKYNDPLIVPHTYAFVIVPKKSLELLVYNTS